MTRQLDITNQLCADDACREPIEQAATGRRREYCDATCRANARRARVWEQHEEAHAAWRELRDAAVQAHALAVRAWEATPVTEPDWVAYAHAEGWQQPYGWFTKLRTIQHGPRPELVIPTEPEQPKVSRPRTGAKGEGFYW